METRAHSIAVGSFALLLLGGLVAFVLWFSRFDFTDNSHIYMIHFKGSVNGLRVNEAVKFHGIPIGSVKKIFVDPDDIRTIKVKVAIDRPKLIRQDSLASIEAQGLTGFSYVQITGGSPDQPVLKRQNNQTYPVITSKQSNIEALFNSGPKILENVQDITRKLNELLDGDKFKDVGKSLEGISALIEKLSQSASSLQQLIDKDVSSIVQEVKPAIQDIRKATGSFKETLDSLKLFINKNQKPFSAFTQKGLGNFQELTDELRQSNQKLQKIFDELEASPLQFLKKGQSKGVAVP